MDIQCSYVSLFKSHHTKQSEMISVDPRVQYYSKSQNFKETLLKVLKGETGGKAFCLTVQSRLKLYIKMSEALEKILSTYNYSNVQYNSTNCIYNK